MPHEGAYRHGANCGLAERLLGEAAQVWALWAAAPAHPQLSARGGELRRQLAAWAPLDDADPTLAAEEQLIARDLRHAVEVASFPPHDGGALEFAKGRARVAQSARAMEAAAAGTPRDCVRAWSEKRMDGHALLRRLAEHHRWSVPCVVGPDGKPMPKLFQFDKQVLFAFSDRTALAARPKHLEETQLVTLVGALLFKWLPSDVDVLVLDATEDPAGPGVIKYPRERHGLLRQVGGEVALELAATDWSQVDPRALCEHDYWIVMTGSSVHQILAPDGRGRPTSALFSSEEALDAQLARGTAEQRAWEKRLLSGEALFPSLAKLQMGMVLNPGGPRSRAFNARFVERLASG
jgi:hypothetical protein